MNYYLFLIYCTKSSQQIRDSPRVQILLFNQKFVLKEKYIGKSYNIMKLANIRYIQFCAYYNIGEIGTEFIDQYLQLETYKNYGQAKETSRFQYFGPKTNTTQLIIYTVHKAYALHPT